MRRKRIAFYLNGTSLARLEDLLFNQTDGDDLIFSKSADGSGKYMITHARNEIVFQLTLGPTEVQSRHYGTAPVSDRSASLTFRKSINSEIVEAIYLTCD